MTTPSQIRITEIPGFSEPFSSISHRLLYKGIARWGILLLVWSCANHGLTLKTIYFNDIPEWLGQSFYL